MRPSEHAVAQWFCQRVARERLSGPEVSHRFHRSQKVIFHGSRQSGVIHIASECLDDVGHENLSAIIRQSHELRGHRCRAHESSDKPTCHWIAQSPLLKPNADVAQAGNCGKLPQFLSCAE